MSHYNKKRESAVQGTATHEGGLGFTQRPENELVGILSTGIQKSFYETETDREKRLREVIDKIAKKNPTFAAKALVYARSVFGQRTVTHLGAVNLMPHLSGLELGKKFFTKRNRRVNEGGIVYRLDDMMEILACYFAKNGQDASIPNALKKGFKSAIEGADAYELAKYQMKSRGISLVDIVNLVHPVESKKNGTIEVPKIAYMKSLVGTKYAEFDSDTLSENGENVLVPALKALVLGILKQFNTSEDKNTKAGKDIADAVKSGELTKEESIKVLAEKKADNFGELIRSKKIGYLALLRNLRNIIKTGDSALITDACALLVQSEFIKKSLVFPHQIDLALEVMLLEFGGNSQLHTIAKALGTAYELSIPNLAKLLPEGRTAVVFDTSGSMEGGWGSGVQIPYGSSSKSINKSPADKAALVAATFAKGVGGDVYHFASGSEQIVGWNPMDSVNSLKQKFMSYNGRKGHGTDFGSCFNEFERLNKQYERVIIISDEQDGSNNVESTYKSYCNKFGTPYVYIINVCGYQNTANLKSNNRVFRLYGYTQDIYEKIPQIEINPQVIIDEINAINI